MIATATNADSAKKKCTCYLESSLWTK